MHTEALVNERAALCGKLGARLGIAGALLLAANIPASPYGYVLFLASSLCLSHWGHVNGFKHQLEMQLVFTAVNCFGAYRWLLA